MHHHHRRRQQQVEEEEAELEVLHAGEVREAVHEVVRLSGRLLLFPIMMMIKTVRLALPPLTEFWTDELDSSTVDDDDPAGAGAVVEEVVAPMCRCDTEAAQKTVTKETVNKGRKFFACPKGMNDGCGFFEWAPAPGEVAGRAVPQKRARKVSYSFRFLFSFFSCCERGG